MLDLLLAAIVLPLLVAVALAALAGLTLVPFVVALELAERRRFSTTRWGAVSLAASVLGLGFALLVLRSDSVPPAVALPGVLLTWLAPVLLRVLGPAGTALGGRAGAHE